MNNIEFMQKLEQVSGHEVVSFWWSVDVLYGWNGKMDVDFNLNIRFIDLFVYTAQATDSIKLENLDELKSLPISIDSINDMKYNAHDLDIDENFNMILSDVIQEYVKSVAHTTNQAVIYINP